jgi:hypothetical protein
MERIGGIDWTLPLVVASFLVLACAVVGYSLGEVASKTPTDVASAKTRAHADAFGGAKRASMATGRRRGRAAGLKVGRRIGTRRGRKRGLAAGRRAAQGVGPQPQVIQPP